MKLYLSFTYLDSNYIFSFMHSSCFYQRIELPNVFVIDLFKEHNHSYYFKAFFYNKKEIISSVFCNSKTKLFGAVQNLLMEYL